MSDRDNRRLFWLIIAGFAVALILSGCSSPSSSPATVTAPKPVVQDTVSLVIFSTTVTGYVSVFINDRAAIVNEHLPITVRIINTDSLKIQGTNPRFVGTDFFHVQWDTVMRQGDSLLLGY